MSALADRWARFRAHCPSFPPQWAVDRIKPAMFGLMDWATLRRGCAVQVGRRWPLRVETHRRLKMNFAEWERDFVNAFMPFLQKDDVVFDIGAEYGEWGALAGRLCGGENIHLFEPNAPAWRRIRRLWSINRLAQPGGCWQGFVSNVSTPGLAEHAGAFAEWPRISASGPVRFESLKGDSDIPAITVDDYVSVTGSVPTILLIDIEGAEDLALEGAMKTLKLHRPTVFLSIHPTMVPRFGSSTDAIHQRFQSIGYSSQHLCTDHEEHWVFWDRKARSYPATPGIGSAAVV